MLGINTPITWKVYRTGKPEAIKRSLETLADTLPEPGKADFLRAKPALEALLDLNERTHTEISFAANGDKDHTAVLLMSSPATHVD